MKIKALTTLFLVSILYSYGQNLEKNLVFWSATNKLTTDAFGIKISNRENSSFAQFSVDYQVNGFDFMTKNFNNKVRNYIIVSASWIDTTSNVSESLRYQQTLFDLCEIYTRQFRKGLKEKRKKIASGTQFVEELNQEIMTEFSNRRIVYDRETNYGLLTDKQLIWENQIQKELEELKDYAFDK
ncbi:MAG: hypothetical protein PHX54_01680 [Lentimicrobiaceae bacterium]|nr:hypothetical protein [Lentimicrobiaceae bacterium]